MGTSRQRVIQCTHRGTCKIGLILKMKRNVVIVAFVEGLFKTNNSNSLLNFRTWS